MLAIAIVGLVLLMGLSLGITINLVASFINGRQNVFSVGTPAAVLVEIVEHFEIPHSGTFVELGCGDGRVIRRLLRSRPDISVIGVENNPIACLIAGLAVRNKGKVILGDLNHIDLNPADCVFTYLSPQFMERLEPKLFTQMRRGTQLVSLQFPLPQRAALTRVKLKNGPAHAKWLYIYKF